MARERLRGLDVTGGGTAAPRSRAPRRPVTIAIDFDRTFTADPNLWKAFIIGANRVGHHMLVMTTKRDNTKNRLAISNGLGDTAPFVEAVLYTGGFPKRGFAMLHGHKVDIWIDDIPETIGAPTHHEVREAEARFPNDETLSG